MRFEDDLVLSSGSKFTWFLCRGIDIDLTLESARKLTSFQCWGRNKLGFCVGDRTCLGFNVGKKWTWFCSGVEIEFVFVWGSKLT